MNLCTPLWVFVSLFLEENKYTLYLLTLEVIVCLAVVFSVFLLINESDISTQNKVLYPRACFFRQDLLYRMRRSCLIPPSTEETDDPFEHVMSLYTESSSSFLLNHVCRLFLSIYPSNLVLC